MVVSFVTNGTLLTRKRSEQLLESGIDEIVVSMDGATEESYEDVRVGSHFQKVIENIRTFNEVRANSGRSHTRLGAITVATTANLAELSKIMKLAISLGANHFQVNGLEPYTEEQQSTIVYGQKPDTRTKAAFTELRVLAGKHGIALTLPQLRLRARNYCVRSMIAIDPSGNVFPCAQLSYKRPFFRDNEQKMHPRVCFGNLRESSLDDIVTSPAFVAHSDAVLRGTLPTYCKGCLIKDLVIC
jgi:MoaA/NifB/PqqE/SkfB family radical SAM enzyme